MPSVLKKVASFQVCTIHVLHHSLYKILLTIDIIPKLDFRLPLKLVSKGNQANTTLAGKHYEDRNDSKIISMKTKGGRETPIAVIQATSRGGPLLRYTYADETL